MKKGLEIKRIFTEPGKNPFDYFEYERRDAVILSGEKIIFEQKGVEVPKQWSQHATNILAQKYFRKTGVPQPDKTLGGETSIKQTVHRLADCWRVWGEREVYFDKENGQAFYDEIVYMLLGQYAAPNSPQWFNTGLHNTYGIEGGEGNNYYAEKVSGENVGAISKLWTYAHSDVFVSKVTNSYERPQTSACFILSVKDDLTGTGGIFDGVANEAKVFKGGSGAGTNFSDVRAKGEPLSNGGTSSGVKSFLNIYNAAAGAVKSGGTTRRAAKMVILDTDHPEILDFINWKSNEEKKAKILIAAGYGAGYEDEAYSTVSGQNSNNSVSASDAFMVAVANDGAWHTTNRTDGKIHTTYQAREISGAITDCTWASGDPGLQYIDTINKWNTCKADGKIKGSNPCVTGDTLISTDEGNMPIKDLVGRSINVRGLDGKFYPVDKIFETGVKAVIEISFSHGESIRLTPDHLVFTENRGDVAAKDLTGNDVLRRLHIKMDKQGIFTTDEIKLITILDEPEPVYDLTEPNTHHFFANGIAVHNCSEYFFLDDTACNLASLKLTNFLKPNGVFDGDLFAACARLWTIVLDITVSMSSYPTENTALGAYNYRTLGLGYGNLGALLMLKGIVYGSREAWECVAGITQKMHATAYETSAEIAEILGAFPRWEANRESMNEVLALHGLHYLKDKPMRNAQVTLLAPTGTIGFIMDFDTTGIEPHYQLMIMKHLAGGGMMSIESRAVRPALKNLGYSEAEIATIVTHIGANDTIEGAPHLKPEHLPIFDCANVSGKGTRFIPAIAHLEMMAAAQPYLSGGISKTVNLPFDATKEHVWEIYETAWKLGIKSVAIYRDGSKWSQPYQSQVEPKAELTENAQANYPPLVAAKTTEPGLRWGQRKPFAKKRKGVTETVKIGGAKVHFTINTFDDGTPCELFIEMKASNTFIAMLDLQAKSISHGLQYGVPIEKIANDLCCFEFAPNGFTDDAEIRTAKSIFDYIGQVFLRDYAHKPEPQSGAAPALYNALSKHLLPCLREHGGGKLCEFVPNGKCLICENCGETTGCS